MNKSRKFAALILITIVLTGFYHNAFAQYDEGEDPLYVPEKHIFYAGVLLGSNFAQVDGDNFAGYHKVGLNVGGIGYINIRKYIALSWEFLYSQKGSKSNIYRYSNVDSTVLIKKYNINVNYAEIPIMINFFDKRKSHIGVGVSYSRLVGSSEIMNSAPTTYIDFNKYPFKKNNIDLLVGAQMHLWKGLFLNIRFQYGLTPIRSVSPVPVARSQQQYNNLWTVRLMYLFMK